jgi:ABC-type branched-subunit amino acid transport system permease subunit
VLFILNRTRLGLEVRAVTQNPRMASSMGINPDRINMLTFGLGSGIAGIAGVAIGLFAQVTSELGSNYIVQSFMTVVVGGVGNIWGTLAGAGMIGSLQKVIEFFNPSNTLAAQTYMIIFIIMFIQFRPARHHRAQGPRGGGLEVMGDTIFTRNPRCRSSSACSRLFITLAVTDLSSDHRHYSEGFGRLVSTSFIKILGKTLCLCLIAIAMDLVWGYCGILSLGISPSSASAAT